MKKSILTILWVGILVIGVLIVIIGIIIFTEKAILTGGPHYVGILLVFVALMIRKRLLSNKAKEADNADETHKSDDKISFDVIETDSDNENGINRQAILQTIKFQIDCRDTVQMGFQEYKFDGRPRISVALKGQQIGFMPDNIVEIYILNKNQINKIYFEINNERQDDTNKNVCSVYLFLKNIKTT